MNLFPDWRHQFTWLTTLLIALTVLAAAVILWQWYGDGGASEAVYVAVGVLLATLLAARRWLKKEPERAAAGLPTGSQAAAGGDALPALRRQMGQVFNLDELRALAFDLHLNYDNLAGETLERKIISLLEICRTQNRLPDLLAHLQRERPHVQWVQSGMQPLAAGPQTRRNRQNLLNHVQTAWIDGFLKQSLHSEVIKLALSYRPEAVGQRPWQLILQQMGQPDQPVPPERTLPHIFDAAGRNLLILGAPGSGKTITMLQLAEALIDAAGDDPAEPLPIVLNLSSWAQHKGALTDWLVEEIFVQYGVAKELTRNWIGGNRLLYLLDGLDEVAESARDDCIAAINAFKEQHPAEMVVCSRSEDYEKLKNRLRLGTAVHIQPLNPTQIDTYLAQEGVDLQAVRAMLAQDPDLQELAQTPLTLSLMTLAYRGLTHADLRPLADQETRRRHLFDHYVAQMFTRRPLPADTVYTQDQVRRWLAHLAHGMVLHEQSIFYIERLQPTWLPTIPLRRRYRLIVGLSSGLIFGLIVGYIGGLLTRPGGGLIFGLLGGLIFGVIGGLRERPIELEEISWRVPSLRQLWQAAKSGLIVGLSGGLIVGLLGGLLGVLNVGLNVRWFDLLIVGLSVGLLGGLIFGLEAFISTREVPQRQQPNQGVWRSGVNGVRMVLVLVILVILSDALLGGVPGVGLIFGLVFGLIVMQMLGLPIRLIGGLFQYGGNVLIQHYSLRWVLARAGILPYPFRDGRLVAFLDAMHGRILLRRVGGGWIFVHRSLLEYFAGLAEGPK